MRRSAELGAGEWPRFAAENFAGEGAAQSVAFASLVGVAAITIAMAVAATGPLQWFAVVVAVSVCAFVTVVLIHTIRAWRINRADARDN